MRNSTFRVVVADDHPRHRRNVTRMLRAADGFLVVGEAEDVDGAAAECVRWSPDALVMADELPGISGLSGVRRIHALRPDCAIVLLSLRTEAERSEKARDGAVALCLDKVAEPKAIVDALRAMLRERPAPPGGDAEAPGDASDPIRSLLDRLTIGRGDSTASSTGPSAGPAEALLGCVRDGSRSLELAPEDLDSLAVEAPRDVTAYRLGLVADALRRRERFDPHLVGMTLLLDQGEQSAGGRWAEAPERVERLDGVLGARSEPAYMLLGDGGSGKTVLLRRLAVDAAIQALIAPDEDDSAAVPFFVQLGRYGPPAPGEPAPAAIDWLDALWSERCPALPPFWDLAERGQLLLLLDGLNEMRLGSEAAHRAGIDSWARLAQRVAAAHAGNRVVFSGRFLDDGQRLSTADLRVPLLRLDLLDLARIRDHLETRAPRAWAQIWPELAGAPEVEVLRRPYYLDLFATQLQGGDVPQIGGAAIITAFIRRALEREMGRANPHLATHPLLAEDDRRRIAAGRWRSPWELPDAGRLVDGLVRLADRMMRAHERTSFALVWLPEQEALDAVGGALGSAVLGGRSGHRRAGRATQRPGDVAFRHQILRTTSPRGA
ncbi:MAG: response regulator [Anaerolineae bacterium]